MAFLKNGGMRIQSTKSKIVRGLDAYFSPYDAVWPLIDLEPGMPRQIWEPAAGNGVIVRALIQSGFKVTASDIADYGARGLGIQTGIDYREAVCPEQVRGVVTNPPYGIAMEFVKKAVSEVPYSAWLLRSNFLEAEGRFRFFQENPPARVWISSRRLPMMHRLGYDGPKSSSNVCYAWFVWDDTTPDDQKRRIGWFDWKHHTRDLDNGY